jgi:hypothetical protein
VNTTRPERVRKGEDATPQSCRHSTVRRVAVTLRRFIHNVHGGVDGSSRVMFGRRGAAVGSRLSVRRETWMFSLALDKSAGQRGTC